MKNTVYIMLGLALSVPFVTLAQPINVELRESAGSYQLFRDGKPYYIKGAGGSKSIEKINQYGGNSIRTWSTNEKAGELLDQAQANGLTVLMGLPVLPPRQQPTFYDDPAKISAQKERCRTLVMKFKDHPAVLMWALGNELDIHTKDRRVYDAVNDMALMIKAIDSNHPVMTVTGGFSEETAMFLKQKCPNLDLIGINYYGDLTNLAGLVAKAGWTKPYAITEWGPIGHWMSPRTAWGAYIEQTSSQKAAMFLANYGYINANPLCIGSYVFYWNTKQEKTISWYSMFMRNGEEFETVDAMNRAWKGTPKPNRSPQIRQPLTITGKAATENISLPANQLYSTTIDALDLENDRLSYEWLIMPETTEKASGGDFEKDLVPIAGLINENNTATVTFKTPGAGNYRLYVFVRDGHNNIATANCPFRVN
jgi:hypothetical protein